MKFQLKETPLADSKTIDAFLLPTSRRYYKDEYHAYGWQVGFNQTVFVPNIPPHRFKVQFSDIGTDRKAAISNALRKLNVLNLSTLTRGYNEG